MNAESPPTMRTMAMQGRVWAADNLVAAIHACEPTDAAQIMTAALQSMETDGPQHDLFSAIRRDATYWAELAPPHELQTYALAALRQLRRQAIGNTARKEIFAALWKDMRAEDKAAFLRAVNGGPA